MGGDFCLGWDPLTLSAKWLEHVWWDWARPVPTVASDSSCPSCPLAETLPSEIKPLRLIIPRLQPAPGEPLPAAVAGWGGTASRVTKTQHCAKSLSLS